MSLLIWVGLAGQTSKLHLTALACTTVSQNHFAIVGPNLTRPEKLDACPTFSAFPAVLSSGARLDARGAMQWVTGVAWAARRCLALSQAPLQQQQLPAGRQISH